ncbi:alpha-L-fucosidase 1 [Tanacetum coccineum]
MKIINKNTILTSTLIIIITLLISNTTTTTCFPTPPPIPILPIPSSQQLSWQLSEMALFLHFGPNTFTDSEWGTGKADPSLFNPTHFNTTQWVTVAKENGFSRVILTAKHHDGFCLWPSEYTEYSVRSSVWKDGLGDVVGDLAKAAEESGVQFGVYLSPWDRHEGCYGKTFEYGNIKEVWLDGAKGEGEKDMEYYFENWFNLIHQLQPGAVIFSDAGPDVRWVGDEGGYASTTCWSPFNRSNAAIGDTDTSYSQGGDPLGQDWVPAECDVSIRPGWFWHPSERPKSATELLELYYNSVGRNCLLLLNVPPNSSGLISEEDVKVLREFSNLKNSIFEYNLAKKAIVSASSTRGGDNDTRFNPRSIIKEGIYTYWAPNKNQSHWVIYLDFQELVSFNVIQIQEPIQMGQRIVKFHVDAVNKDGEWSKVLSGTTVGYRRLIRFPSVKTQSLRLVIDKSRSDPLVAFLGLYVDTVSVIRNTKSNRTTNSSSYTNFNGSQVLHQIVASSMVERERKTSEFLGALDHKTTHGQMENQIKHTDPPRESINNARESKITDWEGKTSITRGGDNEEELGTPGIYLHNQEETFWGRVALILQDPGTFWTLNTQLAAQGGQLQSTPTQLTPLDVSPVEIHPINSSADEEGGTTVVGCDQNDASIRKEMQKRETVKSVGAKYTTRSIRKDSSSQDSQSKENVSVLPQKTTIIAEGTVYKSDGKIMLHNKALPKDCYKVSIDKSLVDAAFIPDVGSNGCTTVLDAVGGFVAWPKNQVVLDPKATPPSTIQMITGENKTAPKVQTKRKNVYVSSDAMQKEANKKKSQKALVY